jgi:hypothetical protein
MAVRHQLISRKRSAVWAVLEDASRYSDWVVGTSWSSPAEGAWPKTGSSLAYRVELGPWEFEGRTIVRRNEPPQWLELEVHSGPLGTARVALDIRQWGEGTLVILDEHPLRGLGGALHNAVFDSLLQIRHRSMLSRLAKVVESGSSAHTKETGAHDLRPSGARRKGR